MRNQIQHRSRQAVDAEIKQLEDQIARLKKERERIPAPYAQNVKDLAERLHEIGCAWNHTDGCGWYYNNHRKWEHRSGRQRAAVRVTSALAYPGMTVKRLNYLLDALPESTIKETPERKLAPRSDERELVFAMRRVFQKRYEGEHGWGQGYERQSNSYARGKNRFLEEEKLQYPWSGLQHRRYLAAARAWVKATGMAAHELAELTNLMDHERGWGC